MLAVDLPTRKPGLWEIRTEFPGYDIPSSISYECTDATSDKLMMLDTAEALDRSCKYHARKKGRAIKVDSVCTVEGETIRLAFGFQRRLQ